MRVRINSSDSSIDKASDQRILVMVLRLAVVCCFCSEVCRLFDCERGW